MNSTVMREVLFRGKRKDNGEWIEGYVFELQPGQYMICDQNEYDRASTFPVWEFFRSCCHEVDPETLCRYTGLNDKNGNLIWENDILHVVEKMGNDVYHNGNLVSSPRWINESNFKVEFTPGGLMNTQRYVNSSKIECMVIGNVFDNPEMMEGE